MPYFGELLAIASAFAWAVGVILFRLAGRSVHPLSLNFFKNGLALVLLALTLLLLGRPVLPPLPPRDLALLVVAGVVGMGISDTLLLAALNRLGAGLLSILWTLYTPMVIGLSMALLGERLTFAQWAGVASILTALVLVTRIRRGLDAHARRDIAIGIGWAFAAMATQAISVVVIKPALERTDLMVATELRLLGGLLFLAPIMLARRDRARLWGSMLRWPNLKVLLPGGFSGTYLALTLMLGGVKHTLASTATVLNQTSNLFIFLLAVLLLGEPAGPKRWAGIVLGVGGAVLVTLGG